MSKLSDYAASDPFKQEYFQPKVEYDPETRVMVIRCKIESSLLKFSQQLNKDATADEFHLCQSNLLQRLKDYLFDMQYGGIND